MIEFETEIYLARGNVVVHWIKVGGARRAYKEFGSGARFGAPEVIACGRELRQLIGV